MKCINSSTRERYEYDSYMCTCVCLADNIGAHHKKIISLIYAVVVHKESSQRSLHCLSLLVSSSSSSSSAQMQFLLVVPKINTLVSLSGELREALYPHFGGWRDDQTAGDRLASFPLLSYVQTDSSYFSWTGQTTNCVWMGCGVHLNRGLS